MASVQHAVDNITTANRRMTWAGTIGGEVQADLRGKYDLYDVAGAIGAAMRRLAGLSAIDGLPMAHGEMVRIRCESVEARDAYADAAGEDPANPAAQDMVRFAGNTVEAAGTIGERILNLQGQLGVVYNALQTAQDALAGYEGLRASLVDDVENNIVKMSSAATTAGMHYKDGMTGAGA